MALTEQLEEEWEEALQERKSHSFGEKEKKEKSKEKKERWKLKMKMKELQLHQQQLTLEAEAEDEDAREMQGWRRVGVLSGEKERSRREKEWSWRETGGPS